MTQEAGVRVEQQRIPWVELYAKLQVSVPAGQGPDLALIHAVEVSHFANDGVLEAIDDAVAMTDLARQINARPARAR